ncbi:MAG TPA: TIGR02587 family membrane protein [Caulobacter sp.]|nr:TIGR02587 family membrane protein [Caulobacter sp.]
MSGLLAPEANLKFAASLALAFGGALLFAFPLLMTMEMWWLGHSMERSRLLVFLLAALPMLLGLSYYAGFEPAFRLIDEVLDALAAFAVGMVLAALALTVLGQLGPGMTVGEMVGKLTVCAIPASIGALVAGKAFGGEKGDAGRRQKAHMGFAGRLFVMAVGAIFLAFNVAPTEEMALIAYMMSPWHGLALMAASLLLLHGFLYTLGFPGQAERRGDRHPAHSFLTSSVPGYAIALAISLFCLWTFGRLEGTSLQEGAQMTVVLGFPAALGAATARLVI